MAYQNTKVKGRIAELAVTWYYTDLGYTVSVPQGENAPYDLILESPTGKLYRIQVRGCSWGRDVLSVSLRRNSQGKNFPLDFTRIEAVAVYDGENIYIIRREDLDKHYNAIVLRRDAPKNNHEKVRWADQYLAQFRLFE